MTLRSRLATAPRPSTELVPVSKVYGNAVPGQILAAEQAQQMTPSSPFGPGEPIGPYDGYSRQPRTREYVTGYNIAARPRLHERTSFDILTGLIDAYDVSQIAIWHRINVLRSVKYRLVPADGYNGDIEGAVELGRQVLKKPDRKHFFKNWLARWVYDVLAYDAGTLYRLRNRGGRCIGLTTVDGTTIAPLLDYWGNEPEGDAPAYVQYVNGLPWDWLTRSDLIYESMRPVNKSIYGKAPIETVILNANTDIRFQLHFLQKFTEGNIPAAFASSPESWTPDQIEAWQAYWDSFMYGDQTRKSQVRWMPGGSTIMWSNEKEFTDAFSLFMMRKTCACFGVVPTDLGFTDNANYSTGESQADVAHKAGELPLMEYVEEILSQFLYDDLMLPLKFEFDRGEDQDDRLVQAQADDIYIKNGTLGIEDAREMRYGLPKSHRPVPRFIFTTRGGPVPLNALMAVAGEIDPETGAPADGAPLPHTAFGGVEGVIGNPPVIQAPLAVDEYGPSALPAMPPQQPMAPGSEPVAKEGEAGPSTGITSDTGIYGNPIAAAGDDEDDEDANRTAVAKELAVFRRYTRARRKAGEWRDFRFEHHTPAEARQLNAEGRTAVAKASPGGQPKGTVKTLADQVYDQLTEDYPKDSLGWVHQVRWEEPKVIPFSQLDMSDRDSWRASHEPSRVREFADRIEHRTAKGKTQVKKPAVVVFERGKPKALIIDGHHRALGAEMAGKDGVLAWAAYADKPTGPWAELHDQQFTQPGGSAPHSGDDNAADQVGKAAGGDAAPKAPAAPRGPAGNLTSRPPPTGAGRSRQS